ncbi:adenine deaminase C-terminal domain-containing protein [Oceanobacillus chungangensis]|uniref:adenine deaminase n=1 Tax=Oceanobacillus chungangensis TaxID=1229152 RepID=A0A3D8PUM7_9BACI|nr:adenine deaminase C-terminal domain-containing protein [Oceanobacillus chungangensis]RDW18968.1 adenosine deaminase [Oceanobacillus chungangensis]
MSANEYNWRNRELRHHVKVVDGIVEPTLILKNGTYLNMFTKQWLQANIWIYNDRIVYVGDLLPRTMKTAEVVDCKGKYLVPGYIEPHSHPFQLTNPEQLANHAARFGTTTLVNDNLLWHFMLDKKKAFSLVGDINNMPSSMYWWARFDSQTALQDEESLFNTENVLAWINHPAVVQGGELTSWPSLLAGNERLLYWMQETAKRGKPIEGHFPGASEKTLTKMKLLGVSSDHEAMTGDEVLKRLEIGYHVPLRQSSIRPDLPELIERMLELNITSFDNLSFTTDGSTPEFIEKGLINQCIEIAIGKGIPSEEAYRMASYNAAKHVNLDEHVGSIAPGRVAHINFLVSKDNPHPESVLAKGKWVVKEGKVLELPTIINWKQYGIGPNTYDFDLHENDLQFSMPMGLEMVNDVIVKPYTIEADVSADTLANSIKDAFLLLIDKHGKWRVNTTIQGFTSNLGALASSFSASGDIVFIGKCKQDILAAWNRLKSIGGGIVIVHNGEILVELPLALAGMMSENSMGELIKQEKQMKLVLKEFGYRFNDPIYSLLFLSATHLPYVRITQQGIIDVKERKVLFPATMR